MSPSTFDAAAFGDGDGRIITPTASDSLADLDAGELFAALAEAGVLLMRGFDTSVDAFNELVARLSSRVISDPAREFYGDAAQMVDAGYDPVGLHLENGNSPFMPTLTWFYSKVAASRGSATTVCDGYRVYERLSATARTQLTDQDIVYSRTVPEKAWKTLVHHLHGGVLPADQITLADLASAVAEPEATTLRLNEDGSLFYAYRTPAVRTATLFGARPAFANSILGPSNNYETPVITFADGTAFSDDLMAEIREVTEQVTEDIAWRDGDVALIDNTRVMHGRRAIEDPRRTIFNAQSYAAVGVAA